MRTQAMHATAARTTPNARADNRTFEGAAPSHARSDEAHPLCSEPTVSSGAELVGDQSANWASVSIT
jgi:hypothetical protein